ncbi:MAG: tetratricopeptide repeat protein [Planctomycetes bacterium]|nr:tetratricopeptide repeat protein [Planctomycetota bacterium]
MLYARGEQAEAQRLFDEMYACEALTTVQLLQYASSQYLRGDHEAGNAVVERVLAANPDDVEALAFLGIGLTMRATAAAAPAPGDAGAARAEQVLRRALALDPSRADAWNALGTLLRAQERYGEAEPAFVQAIRLAPGRTAQYEGLRAVLRAQGRDADLRRFLQQLQGQPSHRDVATQLLRAWYGSG